MPPDFNRLKSFCRIFELRSVTAAAEALHVSPSAVSQQLKKLEDEINVPLFTRLHNGLMPTNEGRQLYDNLKVIMEELESAVLKLKERKTTPSGLLRIGAPLEFGSITLPKVIATYRHVYPQVRFSIQIGHSDELLPMIAEGALDFAFVDTFPTKERKNQLSRFAYTTIFEELLVLACSRHYYSDHLKGDHTFTNLMKQAYIAQEKDARAIKNWFYHHFKRSCKGIDVVLTVANHQAVINGIKCDLGLGIVVSQIIRDESIKGDIVCINTEVGQTINVVSLVQLADKVPNSAEKSFLRHLMKIPKSRK